MNQKYIDEIIHMSKHGCPVTEPCYGESCIIYKECREYTEIYRSTSYHQSSKIIANKIIDQLNHDKIELWKNKQ
jgi:hypothetical protein